MSPKPEAQHGIASTGGVGGAMFTCMCGLWEGDDLAKGLRHLERTGAPDYDPETEVVQERSLAAEITWSIIGVLSLLGFGALLGIIVWAVFVGPAW